tara:strand:- start:1397 stop:2386 length:990 start_codon:yes stop_codon:yes gene_type:complete
MKRRKFISKTLKATAGFSFLGLTNCGEISKARKPLENLSSKSSQELFKISLAQWSIHKLIQSGKISAYEFAALAKKWGFQGLEYVSQLYGVTESSSQSKELSRFIKLSNEKSKQYDLDNLLIMIDEEGDLSVKSKKARKDAVQNHLKWIDAASEMNCHSIRINLFGVNDPVSWADFSKESLIALSEYAAPLNINILVENHGYLSSNASLLMKVINDVNLPNCGTLPDFGNFCLGRINGERWDTDCLSEYNKYQGIEELLPLAFAVSAKSYDFDSNGEETTIDFKRMLQMVKNSGYKGYIGVEYEGDRLSEEEGTLATKNLIIETIKKLS